MPDPTYLDPILDHIFALSDPPVDKARREGIRRFIDTVVNGDKIKAHLAINANLEKDKGKKGALVYILTDNRLIEIQIDDKNIASTSPLLTTIIDIERGTIEGGRLQVGIRFPNNSIGLRYPVTDQTTTNFFKEVDQSRISKING